jgi:hypothetical protein
MSETIPDVRRAAAGREARSRPAGTTPAATAMSEDQLDGHIRDIVADLPGVLRYHTHDSRKSPSGFPDLVIAGPGGVLFRELKRQRKDPTGAQDEWLCAVTEGGGDAGVWRPENLLSGQIARELAAISGISPARRAREADSGGPASRESGGQR